MDISDMDTYTPATILYVEDEPTTRKMVGLMICRQFPDVTLITADDGRQGLDLFMSHRPDIVLSDIRMPVMDGISMTREIKSIDRDARIIFLTATTDTTPIIEAIDIGVSHYVMKPIQKEKLVEVIEHCLNDIRIKRQFRQQDEYIRRMAYYDPLTGLPNRQLFNELMHQALAQAHRHNHDRLLAVLFLDLDRFKIINDTFGHSVGDQLLQAVAQRLKECCRRDRDTVARRGGDEFIILLPEIDNTQEAARIAQKIIDSFGKAFILPEHEVFISTCVGISLYPEDGTNEEILLRNADMAMYRAKERGRNRYHFYNPSMDMQASRRLSLEISLRQALERKEFFLTYQPKVNVRAGRIHSFEALVRWRHPELGLIPPKQFIPLAEETGLIVPLGEWVLRTACAQNKAWQDAGLPPLRVAVNFSPRQFQILRLADMVERVLSETGLSPSCLELEVTEGIMLHNMDNAVATLHRLSEQGVHLSIDDFGTGYSSLSYIKKLPINSLKIDRSFVSDITSNPDDVAIATAVINIANSLQLNVIAEGVETEEQASLLDSLHCPEMQGYFFSEPLTADEFPSLLTRKLWKGAPRNTLMH